MRLLILTLCLSACATAKINPAREVAAVPDHSMTDHKDIPFQYDGDFSMSRGYPKPEQIKKASLNNCHWIAAGSVQPAHLDIQILQYREQNDYLTKVEKYEKNTAGENVVCPALRRVIYAHRSVTYPHLDILVPDQNECQYSVGKSELICTSQPVR